MVQLSLPPGPSLKKWKGRIFEVSTLYSNAGISTSIFLEHEAGILMLDCGDGAVRDMIEVIRSGLGDIPAGSGIDTADLANGLDAVLISHAHFDHYAGLLALLEFLQLIGRRRPLPIIYPEGSEAIEDIADHFSLHLWEDQLFDIDLIPINAGDPLEISDTVIESFPAPHRHSRPGIVGPEISSLSYRLRRDGEMVFYSGDTSSHEALEGMVKDCDLAILEATFSSFENGGSEVHLNTEQAVRIGSVAKEYLLVHFTSSSFEELKNNGHINPGTREYGP